MKIIQQDGFSETELAPPIYKNALESTYSVVMFMKEIGLEYSVGNSRAVSSFYSIRTRC